MSIFERTYDLPLSETDGELRIIPRVRERLLTPQTETALVQPTGTDLSIWFFSDRGAARIDLPLTEFVAEKPFTRSLHRWGVNVNRWMDELETDPSGEQLTVRATVTKPDVDGGVDA